MSFFFYFFAFFASCLSFSTCVSNLFWHLEYLHTCGLSLMNFSSFSFHSLGCFFFMCLSSCPGVVHPHQLYSSTKHRRHSYLNSLVCISTMCSLRLSFVVAEWVQLSHSHLNLMPR